MDLVVRDCIVSIIHFVAPSYPSARLLLSSNPDVVEFIISVIVADPSPKSHIFGAPQSENAIISLRHFARNEDARDLLLKNGALNIFVDLIKNKTSGLVFPAVLGVAGLIGTSETKDDSNLVASTDIVSTILTAVRNGRYLQGFVSLTTTLQAIKQLSVNDKNKAALVTEGIVPLCISQLENLKKDEGLLLDMLLLWLNLAMLAQNIPVMVSQNVPAMLNELQGASVMNANHSRVIEQILWKLAGEKVVPAEVPQTNSNNKNESQITVEPATPTGATTKEIPKPPIMLSYNWAHQPIVVKLADRLKAEGFHVWLDLNEMYGSSVGAMAEAVENSKVVIVCMSRKYKESVNCRLEGEYAFKCRKVIVPMLMQEGYNADGWLGAIIGNQIFYPLTSDEIFERSVKGLLRELEKAGILGSAPTSASPATTPTPARNVAAWDSAQVSEWLKSINLGNYAEVFVQQKITVWNEMVVKLGFNTLGDVTDFLYELEQLTN